jgi:outer membrane receptor protein involved in Fe transport
MSAIYVRGLTGDKVPVFIDGFRFSNAAARGGVSTFFNVVDPSAIQAVEIIRGPSAAQYGSDSMGGSVQYITRSPEFSATPAWHGQWGLFADSVDGGFGSASTITYGARRFGFLSTLSGARHNRVRTGRGLDSHAAVTRFLGLPSTILDDGRRPGTAFTQYGGLVRLNWATGRNSQLVTQYARNQQDGGRRYDQLLGGDGNLIADLSNLKTDFFYMRFDQIQWGWLDSFTGGYSFGSQKEERVNQGGNGNPNAAITHEPERTNAHGFSVTAGKSWGTRNHLLFGGDIYREGVDAPSFQFDPVTSAISIRRGRVPDNARYINGGLFVQDVVEVVPGRLRLTGNLRYSGADYRARAADSPRVAGSPLWRDDLLAVHAITFRFGAVVTPAPGYSITGRVGRGFRAPLITDLGTLGLTGAGFEVAAPDLAGRNATIGSRADAAAVSTGAPVEQLTPEASLSYDIGASFRNSWFDAELTFFLNDISDVVVKQALILPAGAVGTSLGGTLITSQNANGAVFVAASTNPVLVRANFDEARQRGFEGRLNWKVTRDWSLGGVWTWVHAHDRRTGLIPNIEGGTPAPDGYLKLRYAPAARRFWIETYMHAAARQNRLSSLDLADRRTGGERTRGSIQNFFRGGAAVRGLVAAGPNGTFGDVDDILIATGETLTQVQDRVLGVGVNSAPLFTYVPGYFTIGLRGGVTWKERHSLLLDAENLGDRNYRGIFWGMDAPGRGFSGRYTFRF